MEPEYQPDDAPLTLAQVRNMCEQAGGIQDSIKSIIEHSTKMDKYLSLIKEEQTGIISDLTYAATGISALKHKLLSKASKLPPAPLACFMVILGGIAVSVRPTIDQQQLTQSPQHTKKPTVISSTKMANPEAISEQSKAVAYHTKKDFASAILYYSRAKDMGAEPCSCLFGIADCQYRLNLDSDALESSKQLSSLPDGLGRAKIIEGLVKEREGKREEAITAYSCSMMTGNQIGRMHLDRLSKQAAQSTNSTTSAPTDKTSK